MGLSSSLSRRRWLLCAGAAAALSACGRRDAKPAQGAATAERGADAAKADAGGAPGTIDWAVAGDWRDGDVRRDAWRHPKETLEFFGLKPGMTVVEMWPGAGWYT